MQEFSETEARTVRWLADEVAAGRPIFDGEKFQEALQLNDEQAQRLQLWALGRGFLRKVNDPWVKGLVIEEHVIATASTWERRDLLAVVYAWTRRHRLIVTVMVIYAGALATATLVNAVCEALRNIGWLERPG